MKTLEPQQLTDKDKPWVVVEFVCYTNNKPRKFYSSINELSGSRLTAFDSSAPSIDDSMATIRSIVKDIFKKSNGVTGYGSSKG